MVYIFLKKKIKSSRIAPQPFPALICNGQMAWQRDLQGELDGRMAGDEGGGTTGAMDLRGLGYS